jgi:serine/threonine protein kinase
MANQLGRLKDLFNAALDQTDAAGRNAFVERECADDAELRKRLLALLAAHDHPASVLDAPFVAMDTKSFSVESQTNIDEPASSTSQSDDHLAGIVIAGKYKLLERIGEGGMGDVWLAQQTEPVKRQVAVKLIKAGMDSKQVLARFEAERQALAMMDHPNIAKVLDGGVWSPSPAAGEGLGVRGMPYFVMELVKGVPITEYCDHHKLTPKQRLELFVPVCQAIQHAHQKGVIHRDIKPSNVLIAMYDDRPVPKVIDFGVAKATGATLTEHTLNTGFGGIVGTPQYMSPEQATFNNLDIDTRSDVYSLGVLLYELLTGSPPFARKELEKKGLLEILRVVREEEPPKPSTKLSTADALASLSANRGTEPKKLTGILRNELDWIVMKSLEKDRMRRYETANGFAADVNRYLSGEPVLAHPPNAGYRLKKFVQRNRGQVIAASLVLMALLAGIAGTTIGLVWANRAADAERQARDVANQQAQKAQAAAEEERKAKLEAEAEKANALKAAASEKAASEQARKNLAFAKKGNELLGSVFAGLNPQQIALSGRPLQDVLRENLKKAVKELDGSAIGDPLEVAAMQNTLGLSLLGLGEAKLAIEVFEKAWDTRKAQLGPDHPDTLISMGNLAEGYRDSGNLDKAMPLLEETFKLMKVKLGPDHPDTLTSMNNLATLYDGAGQRDKAMPLLEEALKLTKARFGPDHPNTLTSMNCLAVLYGQAGQQDKALPLLEETFKLMKVKNGPNHPNTLTCMHNLAMLYNEAGQRDKALPLLEETLKLRKAKLGPDHPNTLLNMRSLATLYVEVGQRDKALPLFEETLKLMKVKNGTDHPYTLASMNDLASCYWSLERLNDSVPLFEELLTLQEKKFGRLHPQTQTVVANLGVNYKDAGRVAEAIPLLEEAYAASNKYPNLRVFGTPLLDAYSKAGKPAEAMKLIGELLADARKTLPKDNPQLAGMIAQFGLSLLEVKGYVEAEPLLRECLAIREKKEPDVWTTFNTQSMLGGALLGQKKYTDAEPLLLNGYEGMKAREKSIPAQAATRIPEALDRLIELYTATNKPDKVKKYQELRAKYPAATPKSSEKK